MTFIFKLYTIVFGLLLFNFQLSAQKITYKPKQEKTSQVAKKVNVNIDSIYSSIERINLIDTTFLFSGLKRPLKIWIQLPQKYIINKKNYPVIYLPNATVTLNDKNKAEEPWVNKILDSLEESGKRTSIVVSIESGLKDQEFIEFLSKANDSLNIFNDYINFLADSVKPFIDKHYRTLKDRKNTIVADFSFGANLSYLAFLLRNESFGKAGLFSPEFDVISRVKDLTDSLANNISGKLFYYSGGNEMEESKKEGEEIIQSLGEKSKAVIYSLADTEGFSNPTFWSKHFAAFIIWALADGNNSVINIKN